MHFEKTKFGKFFSWHVMLLQILISYPRDVLQLIRFVIKEECLIKEISVKIHGQELINNLLFAYFSSGSNRNRLTSKGGWCCQVIMENTWRWVNIQMVETRMKMSVSYRVYVLIKKKLYCIKLLQSQECSTLRNYYKQTTSKTLSFDCVRASFFILFN